MNTISTPSKSTKPWYVQPFTKDNKCTGIKLPVWINFKNLQNQEKENLPTAFLDLSTTSSNNNNKPERKTIWLETVDLHCTPVEKVRVHWAPQTRCFIIKAKSTFLRCNTLEEKQECGIVSQKENYSHLQSVIRYNKEKNQYILKRTIPLPEYVCGKYIHVSIDEHRDCLIIQSKLEKHFTICKADACGLETECADLGEEERLHRYCQPINLLTTPEAVIQRQHNAPFAPELKLITENEEFFFASKLLRKQLKEEKLLTFPGLMKSPRFLKNHQTHEWILRIAFRLPQRIFRQRDVQVKILNEKENIILFEAMSEINDEKFGFTNQIQIRREFTVLNLVNIQKLQCQYYLEAGFIQVDFPCNWEKIQQVYKENPIV